MSLDKGKMQEIDASGYRFAIVAARYNKELVDALVRDAIDTFSKAGVDAENVRLIRVPGSAELPHVCGMLAQTNEYDAVVALGVVIAGETPHHMIIANSTAQAFQSVALDTTVPVINGVIVTNSREQAEARTVGKIRRGVEFAEAAIEMAWQTSILLDELIDAEERAIAEEDSDDGEIFDSDDDIDCDCPDGCECGGSCGSEENAEDDGFFGECEGHACSCGGQCKCGKGGDKDCSKKASAKNVSKKMAAVKKVAPKKVAAKKPANKKQGGKNKGRGEK